VKLQHTQDTHYGKNKNGLAVSDKKKTSTNHATICESLPFTLSFLFCIFNEEFQLEQCFLIRAILRIKQSISNSLP
jgi:hypothetical protein